MKGLLYLVIALAGCATAALDNGGNGDAGGDMVGGRPDSGPGGDGMGKDADITPPVDAAPLPDAPPGQMQVTLSQTNDMTMAVAKSIACASSNPILGITATRDNSWYRVFKLSDYGITGAFTLQRVTFYPDWAVAGTGTTQPATIKIGTYSGALEGDTIATASITPITSQAITISNADSETAVPPPIVTNISAIVPAGSNMIVEIALPDGSAAGNIFYIGVSAGGESKKSYIRATPSGCNMTTPKALTTAGGLNKPDNAVMLTVTGTK